MARRHYSDRERAAALAIFDTLADEPGKLARAARESGVPRGTLQWWLAERERAAPLEVQREEKKSLRDLYEGHIRAALGAMEVKAGEASYRDLSTAVGILDDKLTRADGNPTDRVDHTTGGERIRSLSDEERADRAAALINLADERRKRASA